MGEKNVFQLIYTYIKQSNTRFICDCLYIELGEGGVLLVLLFTRSACIYTMYI